MKLLAIRSELSIATQQVIIWGAFEDEVERKVGELHLHNRKRSHTPYHQHRQRDKDRKQYVRENVPLQTNNMNRREGYREREEYRRREGS